MKPIHFCLDQKHTLPNRPGIYLFYNANNQLIYVGKAKDIKKRVASYFSISTGQHHIKTRKMVSNIHHIGLVLVNTEYEALLLENNFIKKNQPRYNILLKDSKTYPYLCITHERFPRIITTRQRTPPLGLYFGPFTQKNTLKQIQELLRELFSFRTCSYNLSEKNIEKKKFKRCLEYHIGKCLAPCEGLQTEEDYSQEVAQATSLLKGNFKGIKKTLTKHMVQAAKELNFIKAQNYKKKLQAIDHYTAKSLITRPQSGPIDIIALVNEQEKKAFVSYLHINHGMIVFAQTIEVEKKLQEASDDVLAIGLCHFRQKIQSTAKNIYTNLKPSVIDEKINLIIPKIGEKKELVDLALKNALFFKQEQLNKKEKNQKTARSTLILLQQDLRLKEIPMHIECFDNSNLQGTNPVAAMVCFKKGKPAKSAYRHFHIKTVQGANDVASMQEVIERRYAKVHEKNNRLPDLIIIDGGKGQLNIVVGMLKKMGLYGKVSIIAIAKKLEAIYYPNDPHPLYINKKSPSLLLLQKIRDEAHRFAISFHRQIRSKKTLQSQLATIQGIGPKTISKLIRHFGDVATIKKASVKELIEVIGVQKGNFIHEYFS